MLEGLSLQAFLSWCWEGASAAVASPFAFAQAVLALAAMLSFASYFVPWMVSFFHCPQDLKLKYAADWALVTGGSSGIGLSISSKLAGMGLNVVIVAYPDKNMEDCRKDLPTRYPEVEWRFVDVNLATADECAYLDKIVEATKDINVQIVFSNAGYIRTGLFDASPLQAQLSNLRCNATSSTVIAHHFITKMRKAGLRGCCVFTSSPAMLTPCPLSAMYGATKSFLTELAVSLAPEVIEFGIDVAVIHPSPTATNFYEGTDSIDALLFFKSTATGPDRIADAAFAGLGRRVVIDQGYYGPMMRVVGKLFDQCFLADLIASQAVGTADYKQLRAAANAAETGAPKRD